VSGNKDKNYKDQHKTIEKGTG